MKKTPLFAATALLSALLATGLAQAATTDKAAASDSKATTESTTTARPMMRQRGEMPKMSEATQKFMKETMDKMHTDNKDVYEQMRAKHQELQDIMKAPKFDKSAYLAKHGEIQTLQDKLASARAEAMASVAEKMTAEERAQFTGSRMMMGRHGGKGMMGKGMMGGKGMAPNDAMMMNDDSSAPKAGADATKK